MKIKTKILKLLISFALCLIIWTSSDGFTINNIDCGNYDKAVSVMHNGSSEAGGANVSGNTSE